MKRISDIKLENLSQKATAIVLADDTRRNNESVLTEASLSATSRGPTPKEQARRVPDVEFTAEGENGRGSDSC